MGTVMGQSLGSEAGRAKEATSGNREGAALAPARAAKEKGGWYQGTVPLRGAPVPLSLPLGHTVVASIFVPWVLQPPRPACATHMYCQLRNKLPLSHPPACLLPTVPRCPSARSHLLLTATTLAWGLSPRLSPAQCWGGTIPVPEAQPRSAPFSARNNRCSAAGPRHPGQSPARGEQQKLRVPAGATQHCWLKPYCVFVHSATTGHPQLLLPQGILWPGRGLRCRARAKGRVGAQGLGTAQPRGPGVVPLMGRSRQGQEKVCRGMSRSLFLLLLPAEDGQRRSQNWQRTTCHAPCSHNLGGTRAAQGS